MATDKQTGKRLQQRWEMQQQIKTTAL